MSAYSAQVPPEIYNAGPEFVAAYRVAKAYPGLGDPIGFVEESLTRQAIRANRAELANVIEVNVQRNASLYAESLSSAVEAEAYSPLVVVGEGTEAAFIANPVLGLGVGIAAGIGLAVFYLSSGKQVRRDPSHSIQSQPLHPADASVPFYNFPWLEGNGIEQNLRRTVVRSRHQRRRR